MPCWTPSSRGARRIRRLVASLANYKIAKRDAAVVFLIADLEQGALKLANAERYVFSNGENFDLVHIPTRPEHPVQCLLSTESGAC